MKFIVLFVLLIVPHVQGVANNSLADCNATAANFDNTCTGGVAASSVSALTGANVVCTSGFNTTNCPGTYYTNGTCVFSHKLCVTCYGSSTIRIRVQSNGLPRYCPNVPTSVGLVSTTIDFSVNYNPDVSVNSPNHNPQSQAALYGIVCNISNQASVPSGSNFILNPGSASVNTLAGVSVDGVSIENVNSANNVDPFYPPSGFAAEGVDACLGHPNFASVYHYHMATGCSVNRPTGSITSCNSNSACRTNVSDYGIGLFNSFRTQTVIGIARDGHVIYGPYYSSGVEVTTGFDICNGVFHDTIGNYGYFATRTFPYITGCFGPGNYPSFLPNCTTNPPVAYAQLNLTTSSSVTNATTVTTVTTTTTTTANTTTATTSGQASSLIQTPMNLIVLVSNILLLIPIHRLLN